jgi:hypothetical protein
MYASIRTHKTICEKSLLLLLVVVCVHEWDECTRYRKIARYQQIAENSSANQIRAHSMKK